MNIAPISTAIYNRLLADTGPDGLFTPGTGLLIDSARAGGHRLRRNWGSDIAATVATGKPLCVWSIAECLPQPHMRGDGWKITARFEIFDKCPEEVGDVGDVTAWEIADRIYGDSAQQPTGVPTFGLYRVDNADFPIVGWEFGGCAAASITSEPLEKGYAIVLTFEFTVSRTVP